MIDLNSVDPVVKQDLGRYVVLERIGRGAMGVVLRAYDTALEREVAIKLVRSDILDADAQTRMLTEARAMAQLSHANVVAIHDVDESEGGVVLVMEYVRGRTLRNWLEMRPRPWSEIIARFVEAGRGLAAAHAQGVLHRDFKPSNVLVPDVGEAKVADFGLAIPNSGSGSFTPVPHEGSASESCGRQTSSESIEGTPRYMAPEQHAGQSISPRADQYALCVALWEALAGAPPFRGTMSQLEAKKRGGPPPWPANVSVPGFIIDAVRRGLAVDPEDRWPSVETLLEVLVPEPRRGTGWATVAAAGLVALGTLSVWWMESRDALCTGARAQLEGAWDEAQRARVEAAFTDASVAYAPAVWSRVGPRLDEYAQQWTRMYTETCEATTLRGEQSPEVMDLRMACLRRARVGLAAATGVLVTADAEVIEQAHRVVDGLQPLTRCEDIEALRAESETLPSEDDPAVAHARRELAQAKALREAGRYEDASALVEGLSSTIDGSTHGSILAESSLERGRVLTALGRYDDAEGHLLDVLRLGSQHRRWIMVRDAVLDLMFLNGYRRNRPDQALQYRALAEGLCDDTLEAQAWLHSHLGAIAQEQGDYALAEEEFREAIAIQTRARGAGHYSVLRFHNNLGNALRVAGRYAEAEVEIRQALDADRERLGPKHPTVAATLSNLASTLHFQGKYTEAEQSYRKALALMRESLGPEHPRTASSLDSLGNVFKAQGRLDEAVASFRQSLVVRRQALGEEHSHVAASLANLGNALERQGNLTEAEAVTQRSLALWEKLVGPEHPNVALTLGNLAIVYNKQGRLSEAEGALRRALVLKQETLGEDHPETAKAHYNLAMIMEPRGDYAGAEIELRRAIAAQQRSLAPDHPYATVTRVSLGRVLLALGRSSEAEAELRPALRQLTARLQAQDADLIEGRGLLAESLLDQGKTPEAGVLAEQAWAGCEAETTHASICGDSARVLARLVWDSGKDRKRARRLMRAARDLYDEAGADRAKRSAEVSRWLEEHR